MRLAGWIGVCLSLLGTIAMAHGVDDRTAQFLQGNNGIAFIPYLYIGAKHMLTGYDHLLFLVGVIFFLYRRQDIILYVSLFTLGHSVTLLFGVLNHIHMNPYLIDAIIGFSVVYKAFDNLGGWQRLFGFQPDTRWAVLIFGLFHGFGLATKLQDFQLPQESLLPNMLAFNIGVEIGQVLALTLVLLLMNAWRLTHSFQRFAVITNTSLMTAGLILMAYQLTGYWTI